MNKIREPDGISRGTDTFPEHLLSIDSKTNAHQRKDHDERDDNHELRGVLPISHEAVKKRLQQIPLLKKVHPVVKRYLMEMPHAYLERFDKHEKLKLDDPDFTLDFIYVLKGGI